MKTRISILAATIAAATGFLATPTAQACVIRADGECLAAAARQTARGEGKQQPAKPTTRTKRQKPPLEP
jgi:hypothetical protein